MSSEFMLLFEIGFIAQLVDGALGMAYGVLSNTALLTIGLPPAQASALVHTAEIFTTGASAASHIYYRNVDWRIVARLGVTGVVGAILGAWIVSNIDIPAARQLVYGYLLFMGLYILWRSMRIALTPRTPAGWAAPFGFVSRISRRKRWRRLGTDYDLDATWFRACAAPDRRLSQHY